MKPVKSAFPGLLIGALLFGLALGCGSTPEPESDASDAPRQIVLVTVGGLRTDVLAQIGDNSSPALREGFVELEAIAPSSLGVQSLISIFVGRWPSRAGAVGISVAQPPEEARTLATALRRQGFETALVAQHTWASRPGFLRGFDTVEVDRTGEWAADDVTQRAVRIVESLPHDDSWLLSVHYRGCDSIESADPDEGAPCADRYADVAGTTLTEIHTLLDSVETRFGTEPLVAITGLHGYELGEHGASGSGWTVYEEVVRVPLWLRGGASVAGAPPAEAVSLVDLYPTLVGTKSLDADVDGRPLLVDGSWNASQRTVLSEVVVPEWHITRALYDQGRKYVHAQRAVPLADREALTRGHPELLAALLEGHIPQPPLFGPAVHEALYDLAVDSVEQSPILEPAQLRELQQLLRRYGQAVEATGYRPPTEKPVLDIDPSRLSELESLGYL